MTQRKYRLAYRGVHVSALLITRCSAIFFAALVLCMGAAAYAADDSSKHFDIKAKPLADALMEFGVQSGLTVVAPTTLTAGKKAAAVRGDLAPTDALGRLLKGSGLTFTRASDGTIAIQAGASQAAASHGPVQASAGESGLGEDLTHESKLDEVVVTGTNIRGNTKTPSPVIQLTRDEIDKRGVASMPELLATLPQNFASIGAIQPQSLSVAQLGNAGFATGVNLRGLGPQATLTLIDGHRAAPTGIGTFFDASSIPLSAIERVEIVSDGASALYGSEAVAGVINYIFRKPANVNETTLRYGGANGGYNEYDASQVLGHTWTSGGIIAAVEYLKNDSLKPTARAFSRNAASPGPLIPPSDTTSVSVRATQDISDRVSLSAHYLFSERHVESAATGAFETINKDLNSATLSADIALVGSWTANLTTSLSRDSLVRDTTVPPSTVVVTRQRSAGAFTSANLSGDLLDTPAGPVRAAFGAEHIEVSLLDQQSTFTLTDSKLQQSSVFAELSIPIFSESATGAWLRDLTLTAAARSNYYDVWGTVTNPKLGLVWKPITGLSLHSTWGTSFRAPGLDESSAFGMASFVSNQPDPTSPTGVSRTLNLTGSNPGGLEPETSTNWTAGFDYQPVEFRGLTLSGTYFNYDYSNRINRAVSTIPTALANQNLYSAFVVQNPTVAQIQTLYAESFSVTSAAGVPITPSQITRIVDLRLQNIAATVIHGLDFDLRYSRPAYGGVVTAGVGGTTYLSFRNTPLPGGQSVPGAGLTFTPSKFRARANIDFSRGAWNGGLAVNFVGSYTDRVPGLPDRSVEPWAPVDLRIARDFAEGSPLAGWSLALNVHNIFNADPPFVRDTSPFGPYGYDTTNADPLGRVISVVLHRRW